MGGNGKQVNDSLPEKELKARTSEHDPMMDIWDNNNSKTVTKSSPGDLIRGFNPLWNIRHLDNGIIPGQISDLKSETTN